MSLCINSGNALLEYIYQKRYDKNSDNRFYTVLPAHYLGSQQNQEDIHNQICCTGMKAYAVVNKRCYTIHTSADELIR